MKKLKKEIDRWNSFLIFSMIPTKEQLIDLYSSKSSGEIADVFDVNRSTVLRWMSTLEIPRRTRTEAKIKKPFQRELEQKIRMPLGEYLWHEYVENKRSKKNIREELGISERAVTLYLKRYGIKVRSPQEATNITFGLENMPTELTEIEKQVLYGSLLGDGTLTIKSKWSKNATFQEGHCLRQGEYLKWKAEQLKRFKPVVRELNLKNQENRYQLYTSPAPVLNDLYKKFYNKRKIVTEELLNELTPLGLAVWYMDDGSYIRTKNSLNSVIYTNCFSYDEHEIMQEWFNKKWNLDVRIVKHGKYFYLRFPVAKTITLHNILRQQIHPSMKYKIGV